MRSNKIKACFFVMILTVLALPIVSSLYSAGAKAAERQNTAIYVTNGKSVYAVQDHDESQYVNIAEYEAAPAEVTMEQSKTVKMGDTLELKPDIKVPDGTAVTYQWYKDGELLADETGETLTIENMTAENAGKYIIEVTIWQGDSSAVVSAECDVAVDDHVHTGGTATCIKKAVCDICGEEYGELAHDNHINVSAKSVIPPACHQMGYTIYYCSDCGITFIDDYVEKLEHTFNSWHTTLEPTCTENGEQQRECSVCGHVDTRKLNAVGHEWKDAPEIDWEADCIHPGQKSVHCKNCADGRNNIEEIPALGHDFDEWEITLEPNCTEKGSSRHVCKRCSETETEEIEATGHSFAEYIPDGNATCTENGTKTAHCENCDEIDTVIDENSALGHDYDALVTPPTCTEKGYTTYTCIRCDDTYTYKYVDALGHTFGEWKITKNATCTENGAREHTCSVCEVTESEETAAAGHKWGAYVSDHNATCTNDGTMTARCVNCGQKQTVTETGSALGHNYRSEVTLPTCMEKGYITHTCTRCGDTYQDSEVDALGHTFGEWETVAPSTCTGTGSEKRTCSVCGFSETRGGTAAGHDWEDDFTVDKEPTCTENGSKSIHCKNCDEVKDSTAILATGHTQGETVIENKVDATCTEDGSYDEVIYCTECGEKISRTEEIISALGHVYGDWETVLEPTCTENGTNQRECTVCGETETVEIDAAGHDWDEDFTVDKEPTCTENGSKSVHCKNCDETTDNTEIPAKGHNGWTVNTKPASCTEEGYTGDNVCRDCGEVLAEGDIIPMASHTYEDGKCTVCGYSERSPRPTSWFMIIVAVVAVLAFAGILVTMVLLQKRKHDMP